ncbi:beta-defensin 33 [Ictidomys tridecemlineatus]|uniref:Beta-defensin n=2 Tax=Marmotini TaxID=337730 RepID=A0A287D3C9_ICTTR|nr:beta-defensin 33-like [Ictidomys tridecemlineatus]XP_040148007.1 beta-defensin 33-like [Ictidomys tridecemlineatus]XP_040148011.1 beta-defensin 33-like [Ictidomys tridecemlineatus]
MRLLALLLLLLVCLFHGASAYEKKKDLECEKLGGACKHQKTHGCTILAAECRSRNKHCCRL